MNTEHTNQLINETSPYLLQHAHNPVEWYPWGEEALNKAKKEDKLLLISIGYSACHWCHVMEHESFEDSLVAAIMNANFVCIKVDREERPDVDQVYMDAIQLLTGSGGWPLNCIALPDGRPVYGGTYFRKNDWINVLKQLAKIYSNEKSKIIDQAEAIHNGIINHENAQIKVVNYEFSKKDLFIGIQNMALGFDKNEGGFNGAPKFPMPSIWNYLLQYLSLENDQAIKKQFNLTLNKMAFGGIYDHIGGGFARYSVDKHWHIPHFEKMLYDNSQLISLYSKAYQLSKNEHYKRVVYETIGFITRELTTTEGAFYSSLDADSEGEEGKYYVWKAGELEELLDNDYPLFAEYFSVSEKGNWEKGLNVLKSISSAEAYSTEKNIRLNDFLSMLEMADTKLLAERNKRTRPGLDDKILTSWNALMLIAFLDAYITFQNQSFLNAALMNANFVYYKMLNNDFTLYRTYKNGVSKINGFLDDYAFTIKAFINIYQVTFVEKWLLTAKKLCDYVNTHFSDNHSDFFFYTSDTDTPLTFRKKEINDNVIPSSNSVMAENLIILSKYFGETTYYHKAERMVRSLIYEIQNHGRFYSNWGNVLTHLVYDLKEIVITGNNALKLYKEISIKHPTSVIYAVSTNKSKLPIFQNRFVSGETLIYICENKACKLPVSTATEALEMLNQFMSNEN